MVNLSRLGREDKILLKSIGDKAIQDEASIIDADDVWPSIIEDFSSRDQFNTELERLTAMGFIEPDRTARPYIDVFKLTVLGFEVYAKLFINNYSSIKREIATQIAEHGLRESAHIAATIGQKHFLIAHVLEVFSHEGLVVINKSTRSITVASLSPLLKQHNRA